MEKVNISLVRAIANALKKLAETEYIEEIDDSNIPQSDYLKTLEGKVKASINNDGNKSTSKSGGFSGDLAKFDKTLGKMKIVNPNGSKTVGKDIDDDFIK